MKLLGKSLLGSLQVAGATVQVGQQPRRRSVRLVNLVRGFGVMAGLFCLVIALERPRQRIRSDGVRVVHSRQSHAHDGRGFAETTDLEVAMGHSTQRRRVGARIFDNSAKHLFALAEFERPPEQHAIVGKRRGIGVSLLDRRFVLGEGGVGIARVNRLGSRRG